MPQLLPCAYLDNRGSALPPDLSQNVPPGSVQLSKGTADWTRRVNFTNFDTVKVVGDIDGATLNSPYPAATLIASYQFPVPSAVFMFSLAVSLTVPVAGVAAVYCVRSTAAGLNFSTGPSTFSIFDVVSQQNSLPGVPAPVVRNLQLPLGEGTAMKFDSGDALGIYAAAPADAAVLINSLLTAYYITLTI